jgi:hypothetical protein
MPNGIEQPAKLQRRGRPKFAANRESMVRARRNAEMSVWFYLAGGGQTEASKRGNRHAAESIALPAR